MSEWKPISTAPMDGTRVRLRTMGGFELVGFFTGGFVNSGEQDCGCWQAAEEGKHPKCWTDGVCWASNDECLPSDPPTEWAPCHA